MGQIRYCEQCGSPVVPGEAFCDNCGAQITVQRKRETLPKVGRERAQAAAGQNSRKYAQAAAERDSRRNAQAAAERNSRRNAQSAAGRDSRNSRVEERLQQVSRRQPRQSGYVPEEMQKDWQESWERTPGPEDTRRFTPVEYFLLAVDIVLLTVLILFGVYWLGVRGSGQPSGSAKQTEAVQNGNCAHYESPGI